jgi:hypothetical protein
MNKDYLWDKSGEPDPEIQQLEEILGTLRYQPKPLPLAKGLAVTNSSTAGRNYLPLLAIAATIAVALLGGSLWLLLPRQEAAIASVAYVTPAAPIPPPSVTEATSYSPKKRKPVIRARHDNQEALAAKQQLMFALRLASEKLNDAYRRTQTPSQIKNQHRTG